MLRKMRAKIEGVSEETRIVTKFQNNPSVSRATA